MPFDNLSGSRDHTLFADGIAEDIITELSRFTSLFVTARGSSFAFRGNALGVQEIASRLGVRYLLEGSYRIHDARIRLTVQLIEAATETHIWADRYDREMKNAFAVQDEITNAIVLAIAPQIARQERYRVRRKSTENLDAWSQYQRGLVAYYSSTEEGLRSAARLFDEATEADPVFATAYAYAAASRNRLVLSFKTTDDARLIEEVNERLDTALALDPRDTMALVVTGVLESVRGNHDVAIARVRESISLNPNAAYSHGLLGFVLRRAGRPAEAVAPLDQAMRLSPYDPAISMFLSNKVGALFELERFPECVEWGRRAIGAPGAHSGAYITFSAALVIVGRRKEAAEVLAQMRRQFPGYPFNYNESAVEHSKTRVYQNRLGILREAGLI